MQRTLTVPRKNTVPNSKSQVSAAKKLVAESKRQAKKDLVEQWRFLRKIGAYQTKETAAEMRLTDSRIRAIQKKMREVQSMKKLVRGHVVRPVKLYSYKTKSGRAKVKYDFTPSFQFVRTKNKPIITQGIRKVGKKGYIVENTSFGSKISINKKGEIIERKGRTQRKRTKYRGKDLLDLLEKFDKGTYKFKKHDLVVFHRWGHPHSVIDSRPEAARLISDYISELRQKMDAKTFDDFIDASDIEIISEREVDNEKE